MPPDLLQKATHDAQKDKGVEVELRSHLSIDQQARALGATWLDRQLVGNGSIASGTGFGAEVRDAMRDRVDFLAVQGLAEWRGRRAVFSQDLLATLQSRDVSTAGHSLEKQTGKMFQPARANQQVSGIYSRSVQLTSGRFAVLDSEMGFTLVPWRPVVEQRLNQHVSAIVRGESVTWQLGRQRRISI